MILPPGAFILIGYMMGGIKMYLERKEERKKSEGSES
jgi:Na+-translocating ferredoxin:NAD+ oxidoreductase RnfE subunit